MIPFRSHNASGLPRPGWLAPWAAACALVASPAHAVLGEPAASIDSDQVRLAGARRVAALPQVAAVQVHSVVRGDGSAVHQYVGRDGTVFAIAWQMRVKPDLHALLGQYAGAYDEAARRALGVPGSRHRALLEQGDLVVESAAHLNAFAGRAWLKSRVPSGMSADAIR